MVPVRGYATLLHIVLRCFHLVSWDASYQELTRCVPVLCSGIEGFRGFGLGSLDGLAFRECVPRLNLEDAKASISHSHTRQAEGTDDPGKDVWFGYHIMGTGR